MARTLPCDMRSRPSDPPGLPVVVEVGDSRGSRATWVVVTICDDLSRSRGSRTSAASASEPTTEPSQRPVQPTHRLGDRSRQPDALEDLQHADGWPLDPGVLGLDLADR